MTTNPRIWVLLGQRRGDNNQLLALAEGLGLPFETRSMRYRKFGRLILKLFPRGIAHLRPSCARWLAPPWPDLVIGIGRRTVPVARWIKAQSGGEAKLVRVGHPRAPNALFDLVVTTRQYPVPDGENVVRLPLAMNRFATCPPPSDSERALLDALPRPHLLLSLGGTAPMWRLDLDALRDALTKLVGRAGAAGGSLVVIGSPRTPVAAFDLVRSAIAGHENAVLVSDEVRYPVALADADEQFVTADSVSMISEAVMTGKPVGLIPVEPDARGRRRLGPDPERTRIRDPRRFWKDVDAFGLAGSVDAPRSGQWTDPVKTAVAAVRERLGGLFG